MRAWVISVPMVISFRNVQNPSLSRFSCFIRSHLQEYSYHPVSLSLLCSLSLILLLSLPPSFFFFFFLPTLLSLSFCPFHLTPPPSAPLLFDVSLIPPRLSTLVISSIFQCYSHSLPPHLSHFTCPPFLPSLSILLFLCYAPSTSTSLSPFLSPTSLFRTCNLSHFLPSFISHWPRVHPFPLFLFPVFGKTTGSQLIAYCWPLTHHVHSPTGNEVSNNNVSWSKSYLVIICILI